MKRTSFFALISALLLTLTWVSASEDTMADLSAGILRLHILANSDSAADQSLKLALRDNLLSASRENPASLSDAEILSICQNTLREKGSDYPVSLERGTFFFPQKTYDRLTLPAGNYKALRIKIGSGAGENWWCVMYPPLCFSGQVAKIDEESLDALKSAMGAESFTLISDREKITVKASFKLVELWQELKSVFE